MPSSWRTINGELWLVEDPDMSDVSEVPVLGTLTFGVGQLHERPDQLGILLLATQIVAAAARRSSEAGADESTLAGFDMGVSGMSTWFALAGTEHQVLEGLERISAAFSNPDLFDLETAHTRREQSQFLGGRVVRVHGAVGHGRPDTHRAASLRHRHCYRGSDARIHERDVHLAELRSGH